MGELQAIQDKNHEYFRELAELKAELKADEVRKEQNKQKKEERERTAATLKAELDREIQERNELKDSVDELNARFEVVLAEKVNLERQIKEAKGEMSLKKEKLAEVQEEKGNLERNFLVAKQDSEKEKDKIDTLDKDQTELQEQKDLYTGFERILDEFIKERNDIAKRMEEDIKEVHSQEAKTREEYVAWRTKARAEIIQKVNELADLNQVLQGLELFKDPECWSGQT
ncbi:myosin-6-like isoform X2 [Montipora foliosa]|uniref:myosin-6-like isoform X2 n=1 Tax=Montipora foliosa TaxID=591990 RepID=UPI0035F18BEB